MANAPPAVTPMRGQREDASMLRPMRGSEGNGMEVKVDWRQASWKSSAQTMSSQTWSLLVGILYSKSQKIEFSCGSGWLSLARSSPRMRHHGSGDWLLV